MATVTSRPSTALINFESILDDGEAWVKWVDDAEAFQSILKSNIPWDQLKHQDRGFIQRRLNDQQPTSQLLLNSIYLTMASSFEEFLRATIQQTAIIFFGSKTKYEDITEVARNMHLREAARLLRKPDLIPDYLAITTIELCSAIGSFIPGSKAVKVCPEALGDIDGLIKLENFFERMNAFGKNISFDVLGGDKCIGDALKATGKARAIGTALQSCVVQVSKNRNRIAHTGGTAADVTRVLLSEHRAVLRATARRISAI